MGAIQVDEWGATLMGALLDRDPAMRIDPAADLRAWSDSGAKHLTGRVDEPTLMAPERLVPGVRWLGDGLGISDLDTLALLGERAACTGLARAGRISCGGATRLLEAADGPIAIALARPFDVDLVPALLGTDHDLGERLDDENVWSTLERVVVTRPRAHWIAQGSLLGMAIAGLGEVPRPTTADPAVRATNHGPAENCAVSPDAISLVDLSSLWAGPLCSHLLHLRGSMVRKAESPQRPDGARAGSPLFFDLLNAGKQSVAVDLSTAVGREALVDLVASADVVIEASRPRALAQAGIDAQRLLRSGRTRVWIAITGYGQDGPDRNRSAFGDDAAVAGGLVARDRSGPVFLADAIADPLTGLTAAAAVLAALRSGQRWYVDISMARVAAAFGDHGESTAATAADAIDDGDEAPALPRHRPWRGTGPVLAKVKS